jgi:uncharacterized protein (DUF1015 family)
MDIHPFRGWRYATKDLSDVIAPPYDILDQQDKDELLLRSARNIVAVDLPHVPPKQLGPEACYRDAARTLEEWKSGGVLQQDPACLYVYEQTYRWAGQNHTRRAMLAGVRATPLGQDVIPHEHTFAGPKADRLKLTQETRTQLSPIFGFYRDARAVVTSLLAGQAKRPPDASGALADVEEKIWRIEDPGALEQISQALADVPVYIADGHHRYTTALNYRDALAQAGRIGRDHEANFVLFALVEAEDPGLLVLPTHRLVSGLKDFSAGDLAQSLGDAWHVEKTQVPEDLSDADALLAPWGEHAMGLLDSNTLWVLKLRDLSAMRATAGEQCQAWRELDVAILHTLLLDKALAPWATEQMEVTYTPHGNKALEAVRSEACDAAFLLQGTKLSQVKAVADAGASMPHKSTYFYPKIATGMVLKPLD